MSGTTPSGTIASPGSGDPRGDSTAASAPSRGFTPTPVTVVIVVATVLALALRFYQLSRPFYLLGVNEYDDGPYFGSAVRLLNGALPYRDFYIVQPPGITLLMVPLALLSKVTGTAWGMAVGRILTSIVGAAAVTLAGLLVRHRGVLATVIVCGISAIYPDSIQAAKTVLVEPWLVLFCLIGALAVFDGDHFTGSRRRLLWGGAAFGFAGAVEPWAIFPVLVIAVLSLRVPRRLLLYAGGVAAGFLIPTVPFAATAPSGFFEATIVAQIGGRANATRVPIWPRLQALTGLADLTAPGHILIAATALLIVAFIVGCFGLAFLMTGRLPPVLDLFAVGSAILVLAAFMWPTQFHYHFGAFLAPWLGLAMGLAASTLIPEREPVPGGSTAAPPAVRWGAAALAALIILGMAGEQVRWEHTKIGHVPVWVSTDAEKLIPPGSCLLADEVSFSVMANRLTSDVPGCSLLLDATGSNYALSHGRDPETGAARYPRVQALWNYAFAHAQYVWLSGLNSHRVAWTPQLRAYFNSHFTRILHAGPVGSLYRRDGLKPTS